MTMKRWKAWVALAGSALLAGLASTGCGGNGNVTFGSSGGTDAGGAGGMDGGVAGTGGMTTDGGGGTTSDGGQCSGTDQLCGGSCVNTQTDNNNCGSCSNACSGGRSCQGGSCTCPKGQDVCNGTCVNIQNDPGNCGSCSNACSGSQVCSNGNCTTSCSGTQTACSGACVDIKTDNANCGSCGNACSGGRSCQGGSCTCPKGQAFCNESCVDTQTDSNNCGACGNTCPSSSTCQSSKCQCTGGLTLCNNTCVNTTVDNRNCGKCGTVCSGGATCTNGICTKAATCGNGTVDTGEECDDGNTSNFDGCDASCKYEVFTRMDKVSIQRGTAPSFCAHTKNALGNALSTTTANNINGTLQTDVDNGKTNIIVQALGLDDLTGTNDPALQLGATTGKPDLDSPSPNGIDAWYLLDKNTIDANGIPKNLIKPAAITNHALAGGPSTISILLNLGSSPAPLEMMNSNMHATMGTLTSTPAPPPNANQLATGLKVFETITATGAAQGLCGDTTVESLARIPVPQFLTTGFKTACGATCTASHSYTYCGTGQPVGPNCNSLLDVLVGGCRTFLCLSLAVTPTQPDVSGSGAGTLSLDADNKVQQKTAGNMNAYSTWLKFHAQRVHATGKY